MRLLVPGAFYLLMAIGLSCSATAPAAASRTHQAWQVEDIPLGEEIFWSAIRPTVFRSGNLRIYFREIRTNRPFDPYIVSISQPGRRPVYLRFEQAPIGCCKISVRQLDRSGARYVMIEGFSGGQGCCIDQYVATPDARHPRAVLLGEFEAETYSVFEDRDLDGDGRMDFLRSDDGFDGRFTWNNVSAMPPRIWNVIDGRPVDVSAAPRFRQVFRRYMADQRGECLQGDARWRNASCAAYVAAAARVGEFVAAWRLMLGAYQRDDILEGQTFPQRLRALLIRRHYIRPHDPIPPAVI
jgi:hypothetical protein